GARCLRRASRSHRGRHRRARRRRSSRAIAPPAVPRATCPHGIRARHPPPAQFRDAPQPRWVMSILCAPKVRLLTALLGRCVQQTVLSTARWLLVLREAEFDAAVAGVQPAAGDGLAAGEE